MYNLHLTNNARMLFGFMSHSDLKLHMKDLNSNYRALTSAFNRPLFINYLLYPEIEAQARRDRLHRLHKGLVAQDIGAALLFDTINLRYNCGVVNMKLNASRNPG